jgi:hypothetical protein
MRLKFNNEGCLPQGISELTLDEFEEEFIFDKSQRRQEIFGHYKIHLNDIEETGCCLNHWIDGSFVTLNENPSDIDTLTEFDGLKVDKLGIKDKVEDIIHNAPLRTDGCCHSFVIIRYPEKYVQDYEGYVFFKCRYLYFLFPKIRGSNSLKGFVKLKRRN